MSLGILQPTLGDAGRHSIVNFLLAGTALCSVVAVSAGVALSLRNQIPTEQVAGAQIAEGGLVIPEMRAGGVFIEMPRSPAFADDGANRRLAATPADTSMTARAGTSLGPASDVTGATAVSPAQARISEASGTDIGDDQSVSGGSGQRFQAGSGARLSGDREIRRSPDP
jgi:hypothetical protein